MRVRSDNARIRSIRSALPVEALSKVQVGIGFSAVDVITDNSQETELGKPR